ncbi:hypothetical protein Nepgr_004520 [Nepenthes gracilis]|uniref:Uncharacterized protein n=1 Tax=Nepenthes gracilis TaxID=150966 RepID=A0AAD3S1J6_NEPGR|nr:hypothetical protein Nepgr_004520 [Nepenthes gracilis]
MASLWNKLKKSLSLKLSTPWPSPSPAPAPAPSPSTDNSKSFVSRSSSSSFASRLPRCISHRSHKKTCAICLGSVRTGNGLAIFTAECSHSFHFRCISASIKHGNRLCPICRSKWNELPFQAPIDPPHHSPAADICPHFPSDAQQLQSRFQPEPEHFSDDDPLSLPLMPTTPQPPKLLHSQGVTIKALPEYLALGSSESSPSFAVLVSVQAPPLPEDASHLERAPVDLVTVLDVSGSMGGAKLSLLKRAVCFVAENLGPSDRLSVVTFSSTAQRVSPLRRMTDENREDVIAVINSLSASGGTSIVQGLKKGVRVLEERREKNPVASIMFLSDGRDNRDSDSSNQLRPGQVLPYLGLLPDSICLRSRERRNEDQSINFPVHTFGFGTDHDSTALHAISDASGGTFSFIESVGTIQDGFARCIGGLLSVVAQQLQISVRPASDAVRIVGIPSGRYCSKVSEEGDLGVIVVGDVYADEEKEFLVYFSVPEASAAESGVNEGKTPLSVTMCTYKDPVSEETVNVEDQRVELWRPEVTSSADKKVTLEVDRQRNRVLVAEDIAQAQAMAETGNFEGAQALLAERRSALLSSASGQAGDSLCGHLEAELREIRERMASKELYEETGRAYVLSGMSSHLWQRATTRGDWSTTSFGDASGGMSYETPNMVKMVTKSQTLK